MYKAIHVDNNKTVAIKVVDKKNLTLKEKQLLKIETDIFNLMNHPNIIKAYGVVNTWKEARFICEIVEGQNLLQYIAAGKKFSERQLATLICSLLKGVQYIHNNGIVHRDLKPENILLDISKDQIVSAKIADFGLAKVILPGDLLIEQNGTLLFMAPEILLKYGYGQEVDLWSLGITLYYVLVRDYPFETDDKMNIGEILNYNVQKDERLSKVSIQGGDFLSNMRSEGYSYKVVRERSEEENYSY